MVQTTSRRSIAPLETVVTSDDGSLTFRLRRTAAGLLVQRERKYAQRKARLLHGALFGETVPFERWLDADLVRFEFPIVFATVRREGSAMLDLHAQLHAAVSNPR